MVATVTQLKSSAQAVSYYEKDGYYAKDDPEHRDASFWHGAAAKDAGLRGHVLPDEFEDVLDGWVPGTEIRLGRLREGEHDHRPGWDITFSAPKSVSLEGLVIGDRRVIRAHDDAVRATLEWIERDLLQTRGWDPITRQRPRVAADGMIVAGFRHLASRGGDPQLHTHCILANMTRNAAGEWRSVEPTAIRRSEKLIGAYYRNELARRLQSLGMAVTPTLIGQVPGFELAGYEKSFLDAFSGRRGDILAYLEEEGLDYNAKNTQRAALGTRPPKQEIGLSELVPRWRALARELGLARDKAALRPARPVDPATGKQVPAVEVPAARPAGERAQEPPARAEAAPAAARSGARATGEDPRPSRGHRRRAVPGSRDRGSGGGGAGGGPHLGAPDLGAGSGDQGGRPGPRARALHAWRGGRGDRPAGVGRRADRGRAPGDGPRRRHPAGGEGGEEDPLLHAGRERRRAGARERGRNGRPSRREPPHPGPEGGGQDGAAVGRHRGRGFRAMPAAARRRCCGR